jgi:hypothetical protein
LSKQFSIIISNIGAEVQDTSVAFGELIKNWVNRRYQQVFREINWNIINADYTISVTSAAQDYELPSDFGKEINCVDSTNGTELQKIDIQRLFTDYPGEVSDGGTVERYAIYRSDDKKQYIKFHYYPTTSLTIDLPYIVKPTDLVATGDTTILPVEDLLELGAISDAWRYKRQFAKAGDYEMKFLAELQKFVWEQENQPNQVHQFIPATYNRDNLY